MKSKKASIDVGSIKGIIMGFILVVVLFLVGAELIPEVQTAGDTMNATGAPLAGLFASDGIMVLIIMAAIVLLVIGAFLKKKFGN